MKSAPFMDKRSSRDMLLLGSMILRRCKMLKAFELGIANFSSSKLIRHFQDVLAHVQIRAFEHPEEPNLKIYTIPSGFYADARTARNVSPTFLQLCSMFSAHCVKVQNVPARMFKSFSPSVHQAEIISNVVDSMKNLHTAVLSVPLQQMTKLALSTRNQAALKAGPLKNREPWQALEYLSLVVNSRYLMGGSGNVEQEDEISMMGFMALLFGNGQNVPTLKSLKLQFEAYPRVFNVANSINCQNYTDITLFCPNITKLELTNVPGDYQSGIAELWSGLTSREEVTLTNCKLLSDTCLFGKNPKKPVFLKLNHLKKLTLNKLDQMPMITDNAFILVFRHLELTEFVISSKSPMRNVSIAGIFSLLSGDFVCTIEKFPFTGWTIYNVNSEEHRNFQKQFISSCFKPLKTII